MSTNANVQQKQVICRAPNCRFEVRDTEEDELVTIIQDHALRKHQKSLTAEYIRAAVEPVEGGTQE
jgi:predicted small metal-binding protein